jgi:hypothetical protein
MSVSLLKLILVIRPSIAAKILVLVGIVPILAIAVSSAIAGLEKLNDGCVIWNVHRGDILRPTDFPHCVGLQGISSTKTSMAVQLGIREGVALVVSILALAGVFRPKPVYGLIASTLLLLISFPLIVSPLGFLTLASAACCITATVLTIRKSAQN